MRVSGESVMWGSMFASFWLFLLLFHAANFPGVFALPCPCLHGHVLLCAVMGLGKSMWLILNQWEWRRICVWVRQKGLTLVIAKFSWLQRQKGRDEGWIRPFQFFPRNKLHKFISGTYMWSVVSVFFKLSIL